MKKESKKKYSEDELFATRRNLTDDWYGIFAFDEDRREKIDWVVLEVVAERTRIANLPWYRRLFKRFNWTKTTEVKTTHNILCLLCRKYIGKKEFEEHLPECERKFRKNNQL